MNNNAHESYAEFEKLMAELKLTVSNCRYNYLNLINVIHAVKIKKAALSFKTELGLLKISKAPDTGRNIGYSYIKLEGDYIGKISPLGIFMLAPNPRILNSQLIELLDYLAELCISTKLKIIEHGKKSGMCCCCGRELTDPESIAAGIGPICVDSWGM